MTPADSGPLHPPAPCADARQKGPETAKNRPTQGVTGEKLTQMVRLLGVRLSEPPNCPSSPGALGAQKGSLQVASGGRPRFVHETLNLCPFSAIYVQLSAIHGTFGRGLVGLRRRAFWAWTVGHPVSSEALISDQIGHSPEN